MPTMPDTSRARSTSAKLPDSCGLKNRVTGEALRIAAYHPHHFGIAS